MKLSTDQKQAAKRIINWYFSKDRSAYITLGGYAGTGKTTLISTIKDVIVDLGETKIKVAFCSYTGRAVQNLKVRVKPKWRDTISTIHGLIYDPIENRQGVIVGWKLKPEIDAELIFVDEASMVDENIWRDLLSFHIPIIAVGDHGQLPPIGGSFNLMQKPHLMLEEIHRQAKGNPIIDVSIHARNTGQIPTKKYDKKVIKYSSADDDFHEASKELLENYTPDTLVLCGYNSTRNQINQFIRQALGYDEPNPMIGDRVICLRNNHKKSIYNGMLGTLVGIETVDENWYEAEIEMDDGGKTYRGKIFAQQFSAPEAINFTKDRAKVGMGDLFDFGYALTVHKAQGSQAKRVVLFEERFKKMNDEQWRKWLYTGVTRAEKELFIFGN